MKVRLLAPLTPKLTNRDNEEAAGSIGIDAESVVNYFY